MDWAALGRVVWACAARAQRPSAPPPARVRTGLPGPMPPGDRPLVDQLLADQPGAAHRAVLVRGAAAGHPPGTLQRLSDALRPTPEAELPAMLDPLHRQLQQRSGTTCGSACLVTARALTDPVYALWLIDGFDARTGRRAGVDLAGRFATAERVVHRRTTAPVLPDGRWQLPWPRPLGTPPWAVATELTRIWAGAAGPHGPRFRTLLVDPDDEGSRRAAADAVAGGVAAGWPGALFVGDGVSPRHVTLAVAAEGSVLAVYEPGSGQVVQVPRDDLVGGRTVLGGWDRLWAVVVPG